MITKAIRLALSSTGHFASLRVNSDYFTLLDKERHADGETRLQCDLLGCSPAGGVAL